MPRRNARPRPFGDVKLLIVVGRLFHFVAGLVDAAFDLVFGALGVALGGPLMSALRRLAPEGVPFVAAMTLNIPVLAAAAALTEQSEALSSEVERFLSHVRSA